MGIFFLGTSEYSDASDSSMNESYSTCRRRSLRKVPRTLGQYESFRTCRKRSLRNVPRRCGQYAELSDEDNRDNNSDNQSELVARNMSEKHGRGQRKSMKENTHSEDKSK